MVLPARGLDRDIGVTIRSVLNEPLKFNHAPSWRDRLFIAALLLEAPSRDCWASSRLILGCGCTSFPERGLGLGIGLLFRFGNVLLLLIFGILLGLLGSLVSVGRHLKKV